MDLRYKVKQAKEAGLLIGTLANRIHRSPSTLYKWLEGERNLSPQVEEELIKELKKIKELWSNIDFEQEGI